jgi:exopolysaccharide biosynthesis polyprenyl glycosylphosphotransferase
MAAQAEDMGAATHAVPTLREVEGAGRATVAGPRSLRRVLQIVDLIGFTAGWSLAWLVGGGHATATPVRTLLSELLLIVLSSMVFASVHGLYTTRINTMRVVAYSRLMSAAAVSAVVAFAIAARVDGHPALSRPLLGAIFAFSCTAIGRYGFDFWLTKARSRHRYLRRVVLVANEQEGREFHHFLATNPELGYEVTAIVGPTSEPGLDVPWLGPTNTARLAAATTSASGAIVLTSGLPQTDLNETTRELNASGVHVHLSSGLVGVNYRRLRAVPLGHEPFLYVEPATLSAWQIGVKRAVDLVLASLALLITSPVLVVAAITVKLQDGGPIFFKQTRVGRNGKPIRVHKLRTMSVDAEDRLDEVMHLNERNGPLFKTEADPRVTRAGKVLRATSIDELPQLFDVLRGDMSLVGPRPALPEEVAEFDDALLGRLRVQPGITGLWQVEAREKPSFDSYRRLDLFYVENWSLTLDLAIIIDTIPAVADRAIRVIAARLRGHSDEAPVDISTGIHVTQAAPMLEAEPVDATP